MASLAVGILPVMGNRQDREVETARHVLAAARMEARVPQLVSRTSLIEAAHRQARHMAAAGMALHVDASGGDPVARARGAGYGGRVLGEALAETFEGPVETVAFWLEHGPTRDVLLDPMARDLGLVMVHGADGRMWWDLILGA